MRKTRMAVVALSILAVAATAAPTPSAAPVGATPPAAAAPTAQAEQYQRILASAYDPDEPGGAAVVSRGGQIIYLGAAGMADLELDVPLAQDMVFEIGSITKQFTSAAIMMLAEEGKLSLSDPITEHLPNYPSYGDAITIEHLLTHTSGIVSYTNIPGYMQSKIRADLTVQELIDVFKDLPVEFAPGERYNYNNSGYVLLGAIVEAASGMRYEEFVRRRIFEPYDMGNAYYGCSQCIIPRRASGYDDSPDGWQNQRFLSFTQPYAAGSLMMNVEDLHRWSRALFGAEVVGSESLDRMVTSSTLADGTATGYGYGLGIGELRGHRMISHGGGIPGFTTNALYLPDADVFVAVFANRSSQRHADPGMVANKLAAAAIGEPFPEFTAIDLPEAALRRFVGVYKISEDSQRIVSIRDGALHTQRDGAAWTRAQPSSETHFYYPLNLSHFEFVVENDQVTGMLMYQNGSEVPEEAVRVSDEIPTPRQAITLDRSVLERYVGVYELAPGFELNVYLEGDRLMTQATGQGSIPIDAASETEFFVESIGAEITFVLDADGTASTLVLRQAGQEMRGERRR